MKPKARGRVLAWLAVAALLVVVPAISAAQNQFILRAPAVSVAGIASRHGLTVVRPLDNHDHGLFLVTGPAGADPQAVIDDVKSDPAVVDFEPNGDVAVPESLQGVQLNQSTVSILDLLANRTVTSYFGGSVWSSYVNQPATLLIRMTDARPLASGAGIVAIIDTGVDPNHPVLRTALLPGYDFTRNLAGASEWADLNQSTVSILDQSTVSILDRINNRSFPSPATLNQSTVSILDQSTVSILDATQVPPSFGHGTMVAGIIHLVAPTAQIMPLKAFKADGSSNVFDVLRAVYYAVENGAKVINMSFSQLQSSSEMMRAMNFATGRGVICVSSTGNEGKETLVYPAAFQNVLGVASTNNLDARSPFSNYGAAVADMAAPGEGIITTYPGGNYAAAWGTSFSTPFVSGASSLLLQIKLATAQQDAAEALSHAKQVSNDLGFGRLDLFRAVASLTKP